MNPPAKVRLDSSHPRPLGWAVEATQATLILRCDSRTNITELRSDGELLRTWHNPLVALSWLEHDAQRQPPGIRWVGYLSYDLGRLFECVPDMARDDLGLPLFAFARVRPPGGTGVPPVLATPRHVHPPHPRIDSTLTPVSTFTRNQYLQAVERILDYIRSGDVFQVNLSQRFTAPLTASPEAVYSRLLATAPARYGGLLDFGDHALICNSPELFLHVTPNATTGKRHIQTRPIKGTRPRLPGLDAELLASPKDQAELNMIIDLERNDLGRVCETGSVKVTEPRTIEAHPTVFHGAATIAGTLRSDVSFVDLLRATFPGGSITGAPKIRAMQIIEELEPVRRGPYCGAIGYLASDGTIAFNIAIRTMIAQEKQVHISVGGGIVADSDPTTEYEETLVKARAMFRALGLA